MGYLDVCDYSEGIISFEYLPPTRCCTFQVPSAMDAVLPSATGHAQTMGADDQEEEWEQTSTKLVASSPETGQKQPCCTEMDESHKRNQPSTLTQKIVRWVWFGYAYKDDIAHSKYHNHVSMFKYIKFGKFIPKLMDISKMYSTVYIQYTVLL